MTSSDTIHKIAEMMDGLMSEAEMEHTLITLFQRGETAEEIAGAAQILRQKSSTIQAPAGAIDCCGTGGDGAHTYNISTAVALIAAACGVPMAKHGNRAASSKSGAADVLESLGVNLDLPHHKLEEALQRFNFAFLMAPNHHSAMKHVRSVRGKIKHRTIFNLLGPLANPANTKRQLIGVFDKHWLTPMAEALKTLGTEKAWIVHGSDGLDEITITGPTHIAILEEGTITEKTINPSDFGLQSHTSESLKGGDAQYNAKALRALLNGEISAYRDIVLANTSAVLNIHGSASTLKQGAEQAAQAIDSGKAHQLLKNYIEFSNK